MKEREMKLGCLLNKASHLIKWRINDGLKDYHLTSAQWAVLVDLFLLEQKDVTIELNTPALIAERLQVERPAITRIIDRLMKEGWVSRLDNPKDRRSQLIMLTAKAKRIMPEMEQVSHRVTHGILTGFSQEEITQLEHYITRIIDNLAAPK